MSDVDQQIATNVVVQTSDAYGTPSNQEMLRNDQKNPLLNYHALLRRDLNRDEVGFGLGLLAIAVAVSNVIRQRRGGGGNSFHERSTGVVGQVTLGFWASGEILTGSVLRALLIVFAVGVSGQVVRGVPPTPALLEQAFRQTADILTTVGGMLT